MRSKRKIKKVFRLKFNKTLIWAVSISIAAHLLFFVFSASIKLPGIYNVLERARQIFDIKLVKPKPLVQGSVSQRKVHYIQALKFRSPVSAKEISASASEETDRKDKSYDAELPPAPEYASIRKLKDFDEQPEGPLDESLKKDTARQTRKDLIAPTQPKDTLASTGFPAEFLDKMPGFTPKYTGGLAQALKQKVLSAIGKAETSPMARKGDFSPLEEYLVYTLSTYEDPEDKQKYFKISISTGKGAQELKTIPKEIIFLIDCSLSMQRQRIEAMKRGLHHCLNHLNNEDLFNILAFRQNVIWFRKESLAADEEVIREAVEFVDGLSASENTDAYEALKETVKLTPKLDPSYIILFSDGRPTYGITNAKRIIKEISRLNQGQKPIFAFGTGLRINRYLLDFIAYKNRAWTEYALSNHLIARNIANMYEKLKDPLFLNLRYRVNGLNIEEMVPKSLPDFYRNTQFSLFGTYDDENEFSLQLLGDDQGQAHEFIVVDSLENASSSNQTIAREWAFNKIYHLIGLLEYERKNEKIIEEINLLCDKFAIETPYADEIGK